jgi:N-acetylmuramoyl-L-alanine amidase
MTFRLGDRCRGQLQTGVALFALCCLLTLPLLAVPKAAMKKQAARTQFENAERMREELNGLPASERTRREYQRVMDAYRRVYYSAPASSKADQSVVAVAELLAEMGRAQHDEKALRAAIGQYEFLRREYPGSKYRFDALFTIGQIYKEDLQENDKAREIFQEIIRRYPHMPQAAEARDALKEMDEAARKPKKEEPRAAKPEPKSNDAKPMEETKVPPAMAAQEEKRSPYPLVTGIRHWSTPDYTRVAIDLETEVRYEAGRVPNPDRIFFDLHDTKLASTLVGKSFEVADGFLRRIRIAQFQRGMVRVVLEVDDVGDYSAFLLPNPYRLIIDIHGRQPKNELVKNEKAVEKPAEKSAEKSAVAETRTQKTEIVPVPAPVMTAKSEPAPKREEPKASAKREEPKPAAPKKDTVARSSGGSLTEDSVDHPTGSQESARTEVAKLTEPERATTQPTSEPTVQVVAPRAKSKEAPIQGHKARPTSDGRESLTRALGLKIGRIVVDAGHGGHDTGTIGPNGLLEKDLVLDVALRLGRLLQGRMNADVIYTRPDDTFIPLETRTAVANQAQADLFISIHANSSNDPSARGVETYYLRFTQAKDALDVAARENAVSEKSIHELQDLVKKIALGEKLEESREFASDVQGALYSGLSAKDKSLPNRGVKKAPFIVLIGANMPSILAEISFVSNPTDERKLQTPEYRQKIAESLYKGVARYISGLSGVKVAGKSTGTQGAE